MGAAFVIALGTSVVGGDITAQSQGLSLQVLAQIEALEAEKRSWTPTQQKIDSRLIYAAKMARGEAVASGVARLEIELPYVSPNRVTVDLFARVSDVLLDQLRALGASVAYSDARYDAVRLDADLSVLESIAALPEVVFIRPKAEGSTNGSNRGTVRANSPGSAGGIGTLSSASFDHALRMVSAPEQSPSVGSITTEGDVAQRAAEARQYHYDANGVQGFVTGAGVRIGVLSDGVDGLATSQASGDLPTVTVLPGQAGSGAEGTAMLEIIHDLAPGASLVFATAFGGTSQFAANIRALRDAGCTIIVDDVSYFVESPFQEGQPGTTNTRGGEVSQAVRDVTSTGVLYFASAGNSGSKKHFTSGVWEGDYVDASGTLPDGNARLHDFGASTGFSQLYTQVTFQPNSRLPTTLYWSDPLGASTNDYDLFRLNSSGTAILDTSQNVQNGAQDPYEEFPGPNVNDRLVIRKFAGVGRFLHLSTNRGRLSIGTNGQTRGHDAVRPGPLPGGFPSVGDVFSVAAVNAQNQTFPFNPNGLHDPVESFSSDGPRRLFYASDGSPFTPGNVSSTGGVVLTKPDLAAANRVRVTGAGGFPTVFAGTSAAAPHAAAIAALYRSAGVTNANMRAAFAERAIDIEDPGMDVNSGMGVVMAASGFFLQIDRTALQGLGRVVTSPDGHSWAGSKPAMNCPHPVPFFDACTVNYPAGEVVQLHALANEGFGLVGFGGSADCLDGVVTMTQNLLCTATFAPVYPLTIAKNGTGTGTVTSNPVALDCGILCSWGFFEGQMVTLIVTPAVGSEFTGWSGDADCNDGIVTMPAAARNCTATFTALEGISVGTVPAGRSFTVDGVTYTSAQNFSWAPGSQHTIATTSPQDAGDVRYGWVNWSDGGSITHTVTAPATTTIYTATFAAVGYRLTASTAPQSGGSIAATPPAADGFYPTGTQVELTATAAAGYAFQVWSGALSGSTNPQSVTMSEARAVQASFTPLELIVNGGFDNDSAGWQKFATPDLSYIVFDDLFGMFQFYREPPPAGTTNQAVVFQETGVPVAANAGLTALFDLGNSSSVRKRVSILIYDSDFSDLAVCTFWLEGGALPATYSMRTHTTEAWGNATIAFYAATPGSDGGHYQIDNVSLQHSGAPATETACEDPTRPIIGGSSSGDLVVNGSFGVGLPPWVTFGNLASQITGGEFHFYKLAGSPAGVLLQSTGQPMTNDQRIAASFQLGNSSAVRQRVTVLLHDSNFGDLSACTFWLAPFAPLATYEMRMFTTQAWSDATISFYPSTVGPPGPGSPNEWLRLDNVSMSRSQIGPPSGTECYEPGSTPPPAFAPAGDGGTETAMPTVPASHEAGDRFGGPVGRPAAIARSRPPAVGRHVTRVQSAGEPSSSGVTRSRRPPFSSHTAN